MASLPRSIILGFSVVLLFLVSGNPAVAQSPAPESKTFVVVGSSDIPKAGLNTAKDKAIADGKRIAVEQMTAEILPLEVLIQQFAAIDTVIYNQADKFIQYYKLLGERQDGNRFRVLVQAKVSARMIQARLRQAGILTADTRPLVELSLVVVGSDNLSSFVLFRSALNKMAGVEGAQISEILPNQTTLAVNYRGTASAFAEALLREPHDGYTIRVFQESDDTFRIDLAPAETPQPQEQP
jgi:hypothetical protein